MVLAGTDNQGCTVASLLDYYMYMYMYMYMPVFMCGWLPYQIFTVAYRHHIITSYPIAKVVTTL